MSQLTNLMRRASFLISSPDLQRCPPDEGREIAFAGRSNAGKSSALNTLCDQRKLAKTSKTPGRTQMINFFSLSEEFRLVDLPGYGYAKVPIATKQVWQKAMSHYLSNRDCLVGLILVMDIRRPLTDFDIMMVDWAEKFEMPCHILLTKSDKLSRGQAKSTLLHVQKELNGRSIPISLQTFSSIKEENCMLFTHLSVKEDSHTLYGFSDENERALFRGLISVSGVGPSTAQVVLSTFSPNETKQYIITADVAALQSVKGIGAKTAQRIIIDLKDKLGKGITTTDIPLYQDNDLRMQALSALVALGFSKKVAEQKVDKTLRNSSEDLSVEALVKSALSQM